MSTNMYVALYEDALGKQISCLGVYKKLETAKRKIRIKHSEIYDKLLKNGIINNSCLTGDNWFIKYSFPNTDNKELTDKGYIEEVKFPLDNP